VEARIGVVDRLGIAVDEGEIKTVLTLEASGGCKLRLGIVDSDHPRTAPREPRGDVGGAASELDGVLLGQTCRKHAHLGFGCVPDSPDRLINCPRAFSSRSAVARQVIPPFAILSYVLGKLVHAASCDSIGSSTIARGIRSLAEDIASGRESLGSNGARRRPGKGKSW